jgi:hypothetical protein
LWHQLDFDSLQLLQPFIGFPVDDGDRISSSFDLTGLVDDHVKVVTVLDQCLSRERKCAAIVGPIGYCFIFRTVRQPDIAKP